MSTPQATPPATEPTIQQVQEIGVAGASAVNPQTQTPQQAEQAVTTAVEEKARELKVTLDPAAVKMIAGETISQLEAMGAFRKPEAPAETPAAEGEGAEGEGQGAGEPPAKKTLAQRFLS